MRRVLMLSLVIVSFVMGTAQQTQKVEWLPFGKAQEKSKKEGKILLTYIYSTGCGWCRRFWNTTLTNPEIEQMIDSYFVATKINLASNNKVEIDGKSYTERQVGAMFAVRGTPTTIFITPTDTILAKIPGYMPVDQFKSVLKYFGEGWYKDMTYQEFMESEQKLNK